MADKKRPSKEVEASRRFLEQLLIDCRRTNWPGCEDFIKLVEETLANLPSKDGPVGDDPCSDPDSAEPG